MHNLEAENAVLEMAKYLELRGCEISRPICRRIHKALFGE